MSSVVCTSPTPTPPLFNSKEQEITEEKRFGQTVYTLRTEYFCDYIGTQDPGDTNNFKVIPETSSTSLRLSLRKIILTEQEYHSKKFYVIVKIDCIEAETINMIEFVNINGKKWRLYAYTDVMSPNKFNINPMIVEKDIFEDNISPLDITNPNLNHHIVEDSLCKDEKLFKQNIARCSKAVLAPMIDVNAARIVETYLYFHPEYLFDISSLFHSHGSGDYNYGDNIRYNFTTKREIWYSICTFTNKGRPQENVLCVDRHHGKPTLFMAKIGQSEKLVKKSRR